MKKAVVGIAVAAMVLVGVRAVNAETTHNTVVCMRPGSAVFAPDVRGNCKRGFNKIDVNADVVRLAARVDDLYAHINPTLSVAQTGYEPDSDVHLTGSHLRSGGVWTIYFLDENPTPSKVQQGTIAGNGTIDEHFTLGQLCLSGASIAWAEAETWFGTIKRDFGCPDIPG